MEADNFEKKKLLEQYDDLEKVMAKMDEALAYIKSLDSSEKIIKSQDAYEKFCLIHSGSIYADDLVDKLNKNSFFLVLTNTLTYLSARINNSSEQFDYKHIKKPLPRWEAYEITNQNERIIYILTHVLDIINLILPSSIDFCSLFASDENKLSSLLNLLKNKDLVNFLYIFDDGVLGTIVYDLNWISKVSLNYKNIWHELKAIDILFDFNKKINKYKIYIYMIISNIAYDKQIESYTEVHDSIDDFVGMTCDCIENYYQTSKLEFIDDETQVKQEFDVLFVKDFANNASISITGLLISLFRLAVNDKIKLSIYQKPGFVDSLKRLIKERTDIEKEYALQLLTQLSFDNNVRSSLSKDVEFIQHIQKLLTIKMFEYKKLAKTCENFLWVLKQKNAEKIDDSQQNKHIMISYNSANREQCLKIKERLEKEKYKVWINVCEIHGSSIDSMAKAVENAEIVLMCVTEKYRQSNNCQAEAQYSFRLQKKIIPLIMQKGYHNVDGWLGFIIGDKIFIDFTKYEFNDCIRKLLTQVQLLFKKESDENTNENGDLVYGDEPNKQSSTKTPSANKVKAEIEKVKNETPAGWDESQTLQWFKESKISDSIYELLEPINGKNLYQLFQLQLHTPEFFYKSITEDKTISLKAVMHFCTCLKEIFKV